MKSRSSNVAGGLGIPDPATPQLECQACHSSRATCGVVAGGTGAPPSEIRGKIRAPGTAVVGWPPEKK